MTGLTLFTLLMIIGFAIIFWDLNRLHNDLHKSRKTKQDGSSN